MTSTRTAAIASGKPGSLEPGGPGIHIEGARLYRFGESAIVLEALCLSNCGNPCPYTASQRCARSDKQQQVQASIAGTMTRLQQLCQTSATNKSSAGAISDIVAGDGNLTLVFDPRRVDAALLCETIHTSWTSSRSAAKVFTPGATHRFRVSYGGEAGPDLESLAARLGIDCEQLIERHLQGSYSVAFLGFQPGFAYLDGLDRGLHAPRRNSPRSRIAAGSLAIGGRYTAVYPAASPGGWHIIGRLEPGQPALFDPHRQQAALVKAGDCIRFERAC